MIPFYSKMEFKKEIRRMGLKELERIWNGFVCHEKE
jgi:hypothetical protein